MNRFKKDDRIESQNTYIVQDVLGEGNYGVVYKAKDANLGRLVAIKQLKGEKADIARLREEAWIQGKLNHPNIVPVYAFDQDKGLLITEFECKSLLGMIESKSLIALDIAFRIIVDCLKALAYAHEDVQPGIVHGDVKPANILLNENGAAKLSDFGLARFIGVGTKVNEGSSRWAAPEVLRLWRENGRWAPDYQSDLFSLGVIAYLLLAGKNPFVDPKGVAKTEDMILRDFAPEPPRREKEDIPQKYIGLVMKLIERDRSKRYSRAKDALAELGEIEDVRSASTSERMEKLPKVARDSVDRIVDGLERVDFKKRLFSDFVRSQVQNFGYLAEFWQRNRVHVRSQDIESRGIEIVRNLEKVDLLLSRSSCRISGIRPLITTTNAAKPQEVARISPESSSAKMNNL